MGSGKQKEQRTAPEELIDVLYKGKTSIHTKLPLLGSYSAVYEEITDLCLKEE